MERDAAALVYRLEERLRSVVEDVTELRVDVDSLMHKRVREEAIAEKVARDATERHVSAVRGRELVLAVAALALTAINVAVSVWS